MISAFQIDPEQEALEKLAKQERLNRIHKSNLSAMQKVLGVAVTDPFELSPESFWLYKSRFNQRWVPDVKMGIVGELKGTKLPIYCLQSNLNFPKGDNLVLRMVVQTSLVGMEEDLQRDYLENTLRALEEKLQELGISYEKGENAIATDAISGKPNGTIVLKCTKKYALATD